MMRYVGFLIEKKRFAEAIPLFVASRSVRQWPERDIETGIDLLQAKVYYAWANDEWQQRNPEKAHYLMLRAQHFLTRYQKINKGRVPPIKVNLNVRVDEAIKFFQKTGIRPSAN